MSSLEWNIPTLTDIFAGLFLAAIPVLILATIFIKFIIKILIKNKTNEVTALLSPLAILTGWTLISGQSFISVTSFFLNQLIFYSVAYIVVVVFLYVVLTVFDKFLCLPKNKLYILVPSILLLFTFLYPKKTYKVYSDKSNYEVTSCKCLGFNTKKDNETNVYNACLGIVYSCNKTREFCEEGLCPLAL